MAATEKAAATATPSGGAETKKRKFKVPHTFVIITVIILAVTALTWIVPAGQYVRYEDPVSGQMLVDPEQFSYIEQTPVNPLLIPLYIVEAMCSRIDLMLLIMFSGGAFIFITKSGALQSLVAKVAKAFQNRLFLFIPIMTTVFALICTTQGVNQFIAFAPIVVMIAMAMGLDSITGVAIILLGGSVGFSTGTFNPSTTLIAQEIAGLAPYSGLWYRAINLVVFLVVVNVYLVHYANKIRKDPTKSPMYELDKDNEFKHLDIESFGSMTLRKTLIILALVAALAAMVVGSVSFGWDTPELAAVFLALAVVEGFLAGETPSSLSSEFLTGCKGMLSAAMVIGLATSISSIMTAGNITDTVIHFMAGVMEGTPSFLIGPVMFLANVLVSFVIVSGSGMASAVIPITAPLGDLLGLTRQSTVLAFNFSDGFSNYVQPHSTALMGMLGAVNIPYDRWMAFMWKLYLIILAVSCVMMVIAQAIGYV